MTPTTTTVRLSDAATLQNIQDHMVEAKWALGTQTHLQGYPGAMDAYYLMEKAYVALGKAVRAANTAGSADTPASSEPAR